MIAYLRELLASDPATFWTAMAVVVAVVLWILDRLFGVMPWIANWIMQIWQRRGTQSPNPAFDFPKIDPPAQDRTLVAREDELGRIRTLLQTQHGVEISGTKGVTLKAEGGRGKTALAMEYARRFGPGYDGGKWLRAQSRQTVIADLAVLGQTAFAMPIPEPVTEEHAQAVLGKVVQSGARWLLVYDNVDDHAEIAPFIRKEDRIDVIVTTRLGLGFDGFAGIDLGVLNTDTPDGGATDLLLQEARVPLAKVKALRKAAWVVAKRLDGLPLALVMAGALVREDGWTFERLAEAVEAVLQHAPENPDYPHSVAGAVGLTYGRLTPDAQALADLCAWLAPDGLEEGLFTGASTSLTWESRERGLTPPQIRAVLEDPERLRAALRALRRWSVLSERGAMHRLTQAVLRGRHATEDHAQRVAFGAAAVLAAQFPARPSLVANWAACRPLLPHVQALWAVAEPSWAGGWARPGWAAMDYLLGQAGVFLSSQRDLVGALAVGLASLDVREARLGEEDREIPVALGNLAVDLADLGQFDEAQNKIDRAVALDEQYRTGEARKDLKASYYKQAQIAMRRLRAGGDGAEAAAQSAWTALGQCKDLTDALFGPDSEDMAKLWNLVGSVHGAQGSKGAELAAFARALEITQALPDADQGGLAIVAMNTGAAALELGRIAQAGAMLQQAYDLRVTFFAADNPLMQTTARWLARYHLVQARRGEAGAEARARALIKAHGLDGDAIRRVAAQYPTEPVPVDDVDPWPETPSA